MGRTLLETLGLFLSPFVLFALYLILRSQFPLAWEHWTRGRLSWLTLAGLAAGRQVLVMGRAMERVIGVARECGYLDGLPPFLGQDTFERLPRDKVLALATGSQGEPRAALARMAEGEHPSAKLVRGDTVIFSSRTIPGNEKAVGNILNGLVEHDVSIITDRTHLVHVSGHPRRGELQRMYEWTQPKITIPAHGEPVHLSEQVAFAKAQGVKEVVRAFDGDVVAIEEGRAGLIDRVTVGRRYKDGDILLPTGADCIAERRRLSISGVVTVAMALSPKGDMVGDPDVMIAGLPARTRDGAGFDALIDAAIFETFESLPRAKRRDADFVSGAIERAVRNSVNAVWGKRPTVHVLVVEV